MMSFPNIQTQWTEWESQLKQFEGLLVKSPVCFIFQMSVNMAMDNLHISVLWMRMVKPTTVWCLGTLGWHP